MLTLDVGHTDPLWRATVRVKFAVGDGYRDRIARRKCHLQGAVERFLDVPPVRLLPRCRAFAGRLRVLGDMLHAMRLHAAP